MLKVDKSMPNTSDTATSSAIDRFLSGNIAMIIDGVWQLHAINKYTEDYEIGIAAIPVKDSSYKSSSTTFADRYWSARTSSNKEADQKALKALMSVEAVTALTQKQVGAIPVIFDCIDIYLETLSTSKFADYVDVIKLGASNGVYVPYSSYYNIVDQRINQKTSVWINGDMTSKEFVDYMAESMRLGMEGRL
jgi:ABC-type glycerol-3-phosphate transport system substrate-binding protein